MVDESNEKGYGGGASMRDEESGAQGGGRLPECEGVEISEQGNRLVVEVDSDEHLEVTITVTGQKCRKILRCYWNGREWVCDDKK